MAGPYHGNDFTLFYHVESPRGTLYIASAGGTNPWHGITQHAAVTISQMATPIGVKKSGALDNATVKKGRLHTRINFTFVPNPTSDDFLLEFLQTTPVSSTFSMVIKENNSETFQTVNGCMIKSVRASASIYPSESPVQVEVEVWGRAVAFAESGAFYDTIPDTIYSWSDCSVKLGAAGGATSAITNWYSWNFSIENELEDPPNSDGTVADVRIGTRTLTGQIVRSVLDSGSTEFGELSGGTNKKIEILWTTFTFTFDDSLWSEVALDDDRTTMALKNLSWEGGDLTVA